MGDAFRPPSPAPFVVVTEAATVWEHERVHDLQNIGQTLESGLLSHHLLRAPAANCVASVRAAAHDSRRS